MAMIRARQCVGLLALPDEVLGIVLAYGDLGARFTCVPSSSQLRDAQDRLSPAHEHKLLVRLFPILKPLLDANKTLAPAVVYRRQMNLFHEDSPPLPAPTVLDAYTFYLELQLQPHVLSAAATIYVGTGTLGEFSPTDSGATVSFPIPHDIWSQANEHLEYGGHIRIHVMASRARGGLLECARISSGDVEDNGQYTVDFRMDQSIPVSPSYTRFLQTTARVTDVDGECDATSYAIWFGPAAADFHVDVLTLCLRWTGDIGDMTMDEACGMLEFLDWA
mmetsp:Transcript_5274/g.15540  ORF Transcript_5274/g.15540 Transcript_5274/m.15540 type:complete len:277 (-) Transcript_5274:34-864(-)